MFKTITPKNRAEKTDSHLKVIPCILLTTSESDDDVQKAYSLGANSFLNKPFGVDSMLKLFKAINSYWLESAILPIVN